MGIVADIREAFMLYQERQFHGRCFEGQLIFVDFFEYYRERIFTGYASDSIRKVGSIAA